MLLTIDAYVGRLVMISSCRLRSHIYTCRCTAVTTILTMAFSRYPPPCARFTAHRRDKEFCGEFGLLLPDATRLPIAFDILLSNLQVSLAALPLDEL